MSGTIRPLRIPPARVQDRRTGALRRHCAIAALCLLGLPLLGSAQSNPVPAITSLLPSRAQPGAAAFTLTVNGTGFVSTAVVRWNGVDETTTFVSATQLTAAIPATDIATPGTAQVTVFNPTPGGGASSAVAFTIAAENPAPAAAREGRATQGPPTTEVLLLKPLVRFEDPRNDSVPAGFAAQEAAFESRLLSAVKNKIGSKASVVEPEVLAEPAAAEACKQLQSRSSRLARGSIAEEDKENLGRLAVLNDRQLVLAQFVRVKAGPGRAWNPNTGAIASAVASTLLQAALVSSKTGEVIWKSEQFIRKALRPDTPEFDKALMLLLETLEVTERR